MSEQIFEVERDDAMCIEPEEVIVEVMPVVDVVEVEPVVEEVPVVEEQPKKKNKKSIKCPVVHYNKARNIVVFDYKGTQIQTNAITYDGSGFVTWPI